MKYLKGFDLKVLSWRQVMVVAPFMLAALFVMMVMPDWFKVLRPSLPEIFGTLVALTGAYDQWMFNRWKKEKKDD